MMAWGDHELYLGPELTREECDIGLRLAEVAVRREQAREYRERLVAAAIEAKDGSDKADREYRELLEKMQAVEDRVGRPVLTGRKWPKRN